MLRLNENFKYNSIQEEGSFYYEENNIVFNYTVPEYKKYLNAEYQYLLEGFQDDWSEWSTKPLSFKFAVSRAICI
jgi:hypothetical protein